MRINLPIDFISTKFKILSMTPVIIDADTASIIVKTDIPADLADVTVFSVLDKDLNIIQENVPVLKALPNPDGLYDVEIPESSIAKLPKGEYYLAIEVKHVYAKPSCVFKIVEKTANTIDPAKSEIHADKLVLYTLNS